MACEVVVSLHDMHSVCVELLVAFVLLAACSASWGADGCAHSMVLSDHDGLRNLWRNTFNAGLASAACLGGMLLTCLSSCWFTVLLLLS
jgi:hypothetical protein